MFSHIECTLADICAEIPSAIISGPFGSNISSRFFVEEGVPVIRGNNLTMGESDFIDDGFVFVSEDKAAELNCWAEENDLIFTAAGTIGQVGIIPEQRNYQRYVISNKQLRARVNRSVASPRYVYYWFSSPWMRRYFISNNIGSTVPLLTLSELKNAPIILPDSLEVQHEISYLLDSVNNKISNNKKLMTELEETARLIYDYWFTQFDFPDENGNPYRSSGGAMVYNETLHREIPEGWEIKFLGDYPTSVGGTPSRAVDDYWGGNIAWLKTEEIQDTVIAPCGEYITEKGLQESNAKVLSVGSIIVAMYGRGTAGRVGYLPYTATTNQACWAISPNNEDLSAFLYLHIKAANRLINQVITGSIQQNLNKGMLDGLAFALPPDRLLTESGLASIMCCLCTLSEESTELEALRDWLLPMLMNGQVLVGAWQY